MRSKVASQSCFWRSSRVSGCIGWTKSPVAFMTSTTFLSDSGMASYYHRMLGSDTDLHKRNVEGRKTYQLISPVDMHEPIEQIQDLQPEFLHIRGLPFPCLEMHEGLA